MQLSAATLIASIATPKLLMPVTITKHTSHQLMQLRDISLSRCKITKFLLNSGCVSPIGFLTQNYKIHTGLRLRLTDWISDAKLQHGIIFPKCHPRDLSGLYCTVDTIYADEPPNELIYFQIAFGFVLASFANFLSNCFWRFLVSLRTWFLFLQNSS